MTNVGAMISPISSYWAAAHSRPAPLQIRLRQWLPLRSERQTRLRQNSTREPEITDKGFGIMLPRRVGIASRSQAVGLHDIIKIASALNLQAGRDLQNIWNI